MAPEGDVRACADCGTSIADRDGRAAYCYWCVGRRAARQRLEWQRRHRAQMVPEERWQESERTRVWRDANPPAPRPPRIAHCATLLCENTFERHGNGRFCLVCREFHRAYATQLRRLRKRAAREAARLAKLPYLGGRGSSLDYPQPGG